MSYLLVLLAVSMLLSGLGWIYFIYFFSIGYGFGVSALAVTIAVLFKDVLTPPTAMLCAVMFIFGLRLGLYLLTREKRSPEYKNVDIYSQCSDRRTQPASCKTEHGQDHPCSSGYVRY